MKITKTVYLDRKLYNPTPMDKMLFKARMDEALEQHQKDLVALQERYEARLKEEGE